MKERKAKAPVTDQDDQKDQESIAEAKRRLPELLLVMESVARRGTNRRLSKTFRDKGHVFKEKEVIVGYRSSWKVIVEVSSYGIPSENPNDFSNMTYTVCDHRRNDFLNVENGEGFVFDNMSNKRRMNMDDFAIYQAILNEAVNAIENPPSPYPWRNEISGKTTPPESS